MISRARSSSRIEPGVRTPEVRVQILPRPPLTTCPTDSLNYPWGRIHTAEAVRTSQAHYPAFGCESQEEIHSDVPQLPYRL